jgi:hypothetical protein
MSFRSSLDLAQSAHHLFDLAYDKLSSSVGILAVSQVVRGDSSSTGTNTIASVADDLDAVSGNTLDSLSLDYKTVNF